ncbi:NAD(P)/FAD-dependent oxidoreductase [Actinokineospora sp. UTMC 2448]|uniref:NAD(P)/FAD-dependent oxidoreductase n=1 Tax=Actinokineospora sp. UTMC 2448 TaxID=2268449 RepID=UPI00216445D0|nr:NAD(P)/FAD-dependent oxidoreductase [Actinokineospora sp. UTMC 2448]UVS80880.1 Thioredoxin reductase [Actinokineospora sp. UTMC 2448]
MTRQRYNVVIVGGGAAGLSAALLLGRARRSVLVVDGGEPRNAPAAHMHGFLSRDGLPPRELLAIGREEVRRYGVEVHQGHVLSVSEDLTVEIDNRPPVHARRVLLATGMRDELPPIPGLRDRWGRDVLHCPYCHGWEVRDSEIAVLATGPASIHQALMFRQWTPNLTLLTHTHPRPTDVDAAKLAARGILVVPGEVTALEIRDDALTGVRLHNGVVLPVRALAVAPHFSPRLPATALTPTPHPNGMGTHIPTDATGRTAIPGLWAAGNITDPMATVPDATAAGATAARALNADLITEDTDLALRATPQMI